MKYLRLLFALMLSLLAAGNSFAEEKLPVPRFVSIKSNEANIRTGPSQKYPVVWVFIKKGEPVEVVAEFEHWRKVKDIDGDIGWIHESMLSGKRRAVIKSDNVEVLYSGTADSSKKIALIEPKVRVDLISCQSHWCKVSVENLKGWLEKKSLYGIYDKELFE